MRRRVRENLPSTDVCVLKLCLHSLAAIPFYLPSSMFALNRGGKDGSATIADAFDVCAFGLLAVFNGFVARVLDVKTKQAWATVFTWMFGGSFIAMGSLFGAICLEGRGQAR